MIKPFDLYKTLYPLVQEEELKAHFLNLLLDGRLYILFDDKGCWLIAEWWLMKEDQFKDFVKQIRTLKPEEFFKAKDVYFGPILVGANMVIRKDKRNHQNMKIIKGIAEAVKFLYPVVHTVAYHRINSGKVYIRNIKEVLGHG